MAAAHGEPPVELKPTGRYEWERLVRRIVMPWPTKALCFLLSTYADSNGTRVRPGVDVLAAVTGLSEKTARRRLAEIYAAGLLAKTRRGGGRNGRGRAAEYQLTIPVDLLDRFEMLPPGDRAPRLSGHLVSVQSGQSPVDNSDSPVTQVTAQDDPHPVDNSDSAVTQVTGETVVADEIDRSLGTHSERLSGQIERLTGHLGDRLPPTTPTTKRDHPSNPDPAQPPTAREDGSQEDHADGDRKTAAAAPELCPHGLPVRTRRDGQSACARCRKAAAPAGAPP